MSTIKIGSASELKGITVNPLITLFNGKNVKAIFKDNTLIWAQPLYLYNQGDENIDITGGWTMSTTVGNFGLSSPYTSGTATKNSSTLYFGDNSTSNYAVGGAYTKNYIDLTNYSTLEFALSCTYNNAANAGDSAVFAVFIEDENGLREQIFYKANYTTSGTQTINISSYSGRYRIKMCSYSGAMVGNTILTTVKKVKIK